jgi:hypothetical protein
MDGLWWGRYADVMSMEGGWEGAGCIEPLPKSRIFAAGAAEQHPLLFFSPVGRLRFWKDELLKMARVFPDAENPTQW